MNNPLVTLSGLTFESTGFAPTSAGGGLAFTDIKGWWDSPPPDVSETFAHPSGDGTVTGSTQLGGRTIELVGAIEALDTDDLLPTRDRLARVKAGTFIVNERNGGPSRLASVRRVDLRTQVLSPNYCLFNLFLRADDPLRYTSASRTLSNGSNSISNDGDEHASPTLTLVGPHSALTIVHPDGTYQFAALASGQERVLDFRNGDVWNASTRVFGVESGPRPVVRSGGSTWTVSGLGAGSATLTRFAAWS